MILKQNRKIPIMLQNDAEIPYVKAMGVKTNFRSKPLTNLYDKFLFLI